MIKHQSVDIDLINLENYNSSSISYLYNIHRQSKAPTCWAKSEMLTMFCGMPYKYKRHKTDGAAYLSNMRQ